MNAKFCRTILTKTVILFILTFTAKSSTAQWEMLIPNPTGESVTDIYMRDDSTGFLINTNGLYRTGSDPNSWELIWNIDLVDECTDLDFGNGIGVIVGKNGFSLISRDNGESWGNLNLPDNEDLNSVSIIDADTLVLSSARSIYTSSDGGATWQKNSIPIAESVRTFFTSSKIGHAACMDSYILKTIDGGLNWVIAINPNLGQSDFLTIYFATADLGFASHKGSAEFVTRDGGDTWNPLNVLSDEVYAFDFINDSIGYAVGRLGRIFKTFDAGGIWVDISPESPGLYRDYYAIDFLNEDQGYVGGRRGKIIRTNNGGMDWVKSWPYYFEITDICFPTSDIGYASGRNIMFKTTDGGESWDTLGYQFPGVKINSCYFPNPDTGTVVGQMDAFYRTEDGGQTWMEIPASNFRATAVDMHFPHPDTGFVIGDNSGSNEFFAFTHDGGQTWNEEVIRSKFLDKIHFISSRIGFGISGRKLYKTIDGGQNWLEDPNISGLSANSFEEIDFPSDSVGYVSSNNGRVFKTTNQGRSWITLNPHSNTLRPMHFLDEQRGFVMDRVGNYFLTNDGGLSWNSINGEINWEFDDGPDHILAAEITPNGRLFVAGSFGRIYTNEGFSQTSSVYINGKQSDEISFYPNPTNGKININSIWNNPFQLEIFDLSGRKLYMDENVSSSQLDIGFLEKGIYMFLIKYNDFQYSGKVVLN